MFKRTEKKGREGDREREREREREKVYNPHSTVKFTVRTIISGKDLFIDGCHLCFQNPRKVGKWFHVSTKKPNTGHRLITSAQSVRIPHSA